MTRRNVVPAIRLRGVRHNNLKNFDLDLPLGQLIVVTGLSGSGKSSLAFDTLFAEGQRRYIETFSPYARQFFDRMDKPQVDRIEGIPPAIAIEQRNTVKTTRSTVGTMTELCDYLKLLWPQLAQLYCRQCGQPVRKDTPHLIWNTVQAAAGQLEAAPELLVTFDLPLSDKLSPGESLTLIAKQGYQRLLFRNEVLRLEDALPRLLKEPQHSLTVVQDRLKAADANRARFVEACEHAYHFGKGKPAVHWVTLSPFAILRSQLFSRHFHCAPCDIEYREPTTALFSFNHPVGACPTCRGFGRVIAIDYDLALPDRSKTLAEGAIRPWQTGQGAECQDDLLKMCRHYEIPTDVPFEKLSRKWQDWIINGDPDYGKDEEHQWPRAWYGIKGYFRWLESRAYKMHVRVLLSRYRAYSTCPDCQGRRFQPEALLYRFTIYDLRLTRPSRNGGAEAAASASMVKVPSAITLADFYALPVETAFAVIDQVASRHSTRATDPLGLVLNEVRSRLGYLVEVGLGYLTLDRPTRSLSGGETERVNLTSCLGTRLVNTLYVLDEPSVGLHARDTARLVQVLQNLRDLGNTVVVVEHEASVMRAANQIVDLGPGHGETGGQVVFQGTFEALLQSPASLTGQYLGGRKHIGLPPRRPVNGTTPKLAVLKARRYNLNNLTVDIPLNRFVCLTGVSGSGKTTLAREILLPALEEHLKFQNSEPISASPEEETNGDENHSALRAPHSALLTGWERLGRVVLVDQSPLGKTPRSNPVVYIGAFDDIRELFAQSDLARQRGLNASAFSFNSGQGQCERCRGAGFEKIEMQFLSDVYIRCPDCSGRRYRPHILEVKLIASLPEAPPPPQPPNASARPPHSALRTPHSALHEWSIADLLEATVDEAIQFLLSFIHLPAGRRALQSLMLLQEVGLGYLRLGQPINTLSGGESQRLKLVSHLAEFAHAEAAEARPTLFLFDEPTTGLHFDDIRVLLKVFQRLVDSGHSLLVIEHNLDVIKSADWLIDLGPEAGDQGGQLVAQGPPEAIAACPASHTGKALTEVLGSQGGQAPQSTNASHAEMGSKHRQG